MSGRVAELEAQLEQQRRRAEQLEQAKAEAQAELERLRASYRHALEQLQLMRRRLYGAKAERRSPAAEQLAFQNMLEELDRLERAIEKTEAAAVAAREADEDASSDPAAPKPPRPKPKGRRQLAESELPVRRVEITDPELEGKAEPIGFEVSYRLGYERGGPRRIELARVIYRLAPEDAAPSTSEPAAEPGPAKLRTAPLPKELVRRGLLAPALAALILSEKYVKGVPFYRLEESLRYQGAAIDRSTMCRYAEELGAAMGFIVLAARDESLARSFCLSTDATGVALQPRPLPEGEARKKQGCHKGHFFVTLADRDHVFFEYQPRHTSAAVCEMFKGYSGYIQADAHAVYDALFRGPPSGAGDAKTAPPIEVGCWSHARRKWWEAAVCKNPLGVEGLRRIDAIFAADHKLADLNHRQRHELRQSHVRPLVDSFFAWVEALHAQQRERGLIATAAGYAVRQKAPLRRFLDDGRLRMENNSAERQLRRIAAARRAWLFFGSDDHAHAAANLFSLVASCKLHGIDPEPSWRSMPRISLAARARVITLGSLRTCFEVIASLPSS